MLVSHKIILNRAESRFFSAAFAFVTAFLISVSVSAQSEDATKEADTSSWAAAVDKNVIEFAANDTKTASAAALSEVRKISANVQQLKKEVVELNKDLRVMEETILFPSSTKYSVFVSSSAGQFFTLESVKLKIDGKLVATHLYSDRQRQSLQRGGIQKLYITNLNEGKHTATAFFTGIGPNGRPYKRAASVDFTKGGASKYLEIAIKDNGSTQEPVFEMKQW